MIPRRDPHEPVLPSMRGGVAGPWSRGGEALRRGTHQSQPGCPDHSISYREQVGELRLLGRYLWIGLGLTGSPSRTVVPRMGCFDAARTRGVGRGQWLVRRVATVDRPRGSGPRARRILVVIRVVGGTRPARSEGIRDNPQQRRAGVSEGLIQAL